jgi:hypothetical protein
MTEHLLFYQPLQRLSRRWLSTSLFFADKITAVEPLHKSEVVFDRAISRFKLLSSPRLGFYNAALMNAKTPVSKRLLYDQLQGLSRQLNLREVSTMPDPADDHFLAEAYDQGLIERFELTPINEHVKTLLSEVKNTIKDFPGVERIPPPESRYASLLLNNQMRESVDDLIQCFPGEVVDEMYIPLDYNPAGNSSKFWQASDWVRVNKAFLDHFFYSIIVRLAELKRLPVVTDTEQYFDLSNQIRFQHPSSEGLVNEGSLFQITLENLPSPKDMSIDSIVRFKKKYETELKQFRWEFESFTKLLQTGEKHTESLKKEMHRLYDKEIRLSIEVLEKALKGMRVKFTKSFITRAAFISGSSPLVLGQAFERAGVKDIPAFVTFLFGAGVLIAQSVHEYKYAKNAEITKSPVNYLYRVQKYLS